MKFQDIKGFLGRAARKLASPKTVAVLGAAVALFQLAIAIEEVRNSISDAGDEGDDDR